MKIESDNKEMQLAFDMINETNNSFFLTGKAGTGKSTFLKYIIDHVDKNIVVVAPTGIAAINVSGVTIHSLFQFPLRPLLPEDDAIKTFQKSHFKAKLFAEMETLIIDEVSMVRADIIDAIDCSLRRNGGKSNIPFGGKQVILVGDIFQLEPVVEKKSNEYEIIKEIYDSAYFFNAKVFDKFILSTIELKKSYRQDNEEFISILDKVRTNTIKPSDIDKINQRVFSESELKENEFTITLTSNNEQAEKVNSLKILELKSKPFSFIANISGEFEASKYPTDENLILKEGAQVIFIKNDPQKRWVNGSVGKITGLNNELVIVKLTNGSAFNVDKMKWENARYKYDRKNRKIENSVVGTFEQYPLKLAWAITIHKSQGMTFEKVIIDLGEGTFAGGQAYVALSRVTNFDGLFLKQKIIPNHIYVSREILDFASTNNDFETIERQLKKEKELFKFLKLGNYDRVAEIYFNQANDAILENDVKNAYKNILLGYKYIVCDCGLGWRKRIEIDKILLESENYFFHQEKIHLIKTYIYLMSNEYELALDNVNRFIDYNQNEELGYYLKGRILTGQEEYEEALESYTNALSYEKTKRTLYRIGRLKEEIFGNIGVPEIYESALGIESYHSVFCLAEYSQKHGIRLPEINTYFRHLFNDVNTFFFILDQFSDEKIKLANGTEVNLIEEKKKLNDALVHQKMLFVPNLEVNVEETSNSYDYSNSSYEEFGGYMGYDDDTINDAFEGDPSNIWNIE